MFNDKLYFAGRDDDHGVELWSSDGTSAGTGFLKDLRTGTCCSSSQSSGPVRASLDRMRTPHQLSPALSVPLIACSRVCLQRFFVVFDNHLFFRAPVDGYEHHLLKSDGTASGTVVVKKISYYSRPVIFNNEFFFVSDDGIWSSDGTADGTSSFKDLVNVGVRSL